MNVQKTLGRAAKGLNQRLGILPWLAGEPRPPAGGFDLAGEKHLDWAWVCVNLPKGAKRALDVGSGQSPIVPAMLELGYEVFAVDLYNGMSDQLKGFTFIQGDFNTLQLDGGFDVIVACSTVEHIGLSGRFGSGEDQDGDLAAMRKIGQLLIPDGIVFLTIPVGRDGIYRPWHRIYGRQRFPKLLEGFEIRQANYFVKEPWGPWEKAPRDVALDFPADVSRYALAELMLRKRTIIENGMAESS
jgi:SAM-dependent methyltransferase